ncbi:MAG TPA: inositol monophosphatase family protein [Actinomycetes bacterium]|nr:inositol monophosphatase family protein [Actinomycetes bacterium]
MEPAARADDLALALELADAASVVTMAAFGGRHFVDLKSDATPVTEVDHATERAIRDRIAQERPGDGVLGEELGHDPGSNGRVWVIDPIDGTKMFAEGIPLWSTLIALRDGDEVVVAVADAPALGERFRAVRGGGAWFGDDRVEVSAIDTIGESLLLHAALEEFARDGGTGVDALVRLAGRCRGTRGIGDGWAHLLVARGAAEALVEQGPCFEWDWAATGLIVEEAGGRVTRLEGGSPRPGGHLLVSNGRVDDQVRAALADTGAG